MTRKAVTDAVRDLEQQLETAQSAYLKANGWTHTSSTTPGCYWVWHRDYNGQALMGPTDFAITLQRAIDGRDCTCDDDFFDVRCVVHGETTEVPR